METISLVKISNPISGYVLSTTSGNYFFHNIESVWIAMMIEKSNCNELDFNEV